MEHATYIGKAKSERNLYCIRADADWPTAPPLNSSKGRTVWTNRISKSISLHTFNLKYFPMGSTYVSVSKIGFLS